MQPTATVLVYSDNANTREQVRLAAGRRPAADAPQIEFLECATLPAVLEALDAGRHRRLRAGRRDRARRRDGRVPADQGRDLPLPAGAAADRPPPGRLAGHLEPCGRRCDAPGGPGGVRGRPGGACCARRLLDTGLERARCGALRPADAVRAGIERAPALPARPLRVPGRRCGRLVPFSALPSRHSFQGMFQSPKPLSNGVMSSPSLLTTLTMSPTRTMFEEPLGVAGGHARAAVADVGGALGADRPGRGVHVLAAPGDPGGPVDGQVVGVGAAADADVALAHPDEALLAQHHLDAVAGGEAGLAGGDRDGVDLFAVAQHRHLVRRRRR